MSLKTFVTKLRDDQETVFQLENIVNIFKLYNTITYSTILSDFSFLSSCKGIIPSIKVLNVLHLRDVAWHVPRTTIVYKANFDDISPLLFKHKVRN